MNIKKYDISLNTLDFPQCKIAECIVAENNGLLEQVAFRYEPSYLKNDRAFSIDPATLPLASEAITLRCDRGKPGFLDDFLPDAWGAKVLTRLAFYQKKMKLNPNSAIDMLALCGDSHIGALAITPHEQDGVFDNGLPYEELFVSEKIAQQINDDQMSSLTESAFNLVYLANSGSGAGGARPKALIEKEGRYFLAKFNQTGQKDDYNNARVELACMRMAKAAGIDAPDSEVINNVNGRDVLLVERFDIEHGHRKHLITINALLKNPQTQQDQGGAFSYNDIFRLLSSHSMRVAEDGMQLLKRMFFNECINNLDDHERNFSLIHDGTRGYHFAPAYDLVPTLAHGQYPVAGYGYQPYRPKPSNHGSLGRVFGLTKPEVKVCAEEVMDIVSQWKDFAKEADVDPKESNHVAKYFNL